MSSSPAEQPRDRSEQGKEFRSHRNIARIHATKQISALECGWVVRQPKAYPVYDDDAKNVEVVRKELEAKYPNMHLVGRNGMHKYNNQDHAMMTAMLCVQNILTDRKIYDLWKVNQDAEYHEAGAAGREQTTGATGLRMVPTRVKHEEPAAAQPGRWSDRMGSRNGPSSGAVGAAADLRPPPRDL